MRGRKVQKRGRRLRTNEASWGSARWGGLWGWGILGTTRNAEPPLAGGRFCGRWRSRVPVPREAAGAAFTAEGFNIKGHRGGCDGLLGSAKAMGRGEATGGQRIADTGGRKPGEISTACVNKA